MKLLKHFRADKDLMKAAAKLAIDPAFEAIVDVLNSEGFVLQLQSSSGLPPDDKSHRLGIIEGYSRCLLTLSQIFEPPPEQPPPIREEYRDPTAPAKPKRK